MLDAVKLIQSGYPTRIPYADIHSKYSAHMPERVQSLTPPQFCEVVAEVCDVGRKDYALGLERMFFRQVRLGLRLPCTLTRAPALTLTLTAGLRGVSRGAERGRPGGDGAGPQCEARALRAEEGGANPSPNPSPNLNPDPNPTPIPTPTAIPNPNPNPNPDRDPNQVARGIIETDLRMWACRRRHAVLVIELRKKEAEERRKEEERRRREEEQRKRKAG